MKAITIVTALSLCLLSHAAIADEEKERKEKRRDRGIQWSYLEFNHLNYDTEVGGVDVDSDGYMLKLSLELGHSLFAVVDRGSAKGSFAGSNFDIDTDGYGLGFHGDSWFASYTRNNWELDQSEYDVNITRLGFRDMWSDKLEFNASYSWNHIRGVDNVDGFQLGFAFELWSDFNLTARYETIGGHLDIDYYTFGLRLDF